MAKTHYGYKDGQFKQGKCEVTTRKTQTKSTTYVSTFLRH